MAGDLLERRQLRNGLWLCFWDESRPVAGDRYYVGVRATVAVPLPKEPQDGIPQEVLQLLKQRVGEHVYYQLLEERNFVPEGQVSATREELKEVFLQNVFPYLSHSDFGRRFLISKAKEVKNDMALGEDYLEKSLEGLRIP